MKGLSNLKPSLSSVGSSIQGLPEPAENRGNANQRGYTYRWQQESKAFLAKNPLCAECTREGFIELAKVVDHVLPHRGSQQLFWDRSNWQPLCKSHHDAKTGRGE